MYKNTEEVYKEIVKGLYKLHVDYKDTLMEAPDVCMEQYSDMIDNIYRKFYSFGKVSFMTGARKDTTVDYHSGLKNYILPEYYEIPYENLKIDSENKYKKVFDELMEYYAEKLGEFRFDEDEVNKIFAKIDLK